MHVFQSRGLPEEWLNDITLAGANDACSRDFCIGPAGEVTCRCQTCTAWRKFVSGRMFGLRVYELMTVELVKGLAEHLVRGATAGLNIILEVGAGNGRLSYFLSRELRNTADCTCSLLPQLSSGASIESDLRACARCSTAAPGGKAFVVICTDSSSRGLHAESGALFPVAEMDYQAALTRFAPHVVLACWMELGQDWTLGELLSRPCPPSSASALGSPICQHSHALAWELSTRANQRVHTRAHSRSRVSVSGSVCLSASPRWGAAGSRGCIIERTV